MQRHDPLQLIGQIAAMLGLTAGEGVLLGRCVCGRWSTPVNNEPKNLRLLTIPPTEMPPKFTP
jgi:hypothetical protein